MEAVVQQERLKQLARYLQEQLKTQSEITPLQVQCVLKESLMVLVQHPPDRAPDSQQLFHSIQQSILKLSPARAQPFLLAIQNSGAQVRLFIRVLGQPKPYASHAFVWVQSGQHPLSDPTNDLTTTPAAEIGTTRIQADEEEITVKDTKHLPQILDQSNIPTAPAPDVPAPDVPAPDVSAPDAPDKEPGGELVHTPVKSPPKTAALSSVAPSAAIAQLPGATEARSPKKSWLIAGGGVAAAALLGWGGYAVTRPCVLGSCEPLQTAQSLSQQATQTLQQNQSGAANQQATQQATQQLTEAQRLIAEIPPWSSHYGEAQTLEQGLNQVLAAESKAAAATQKGLAANPSAADWQGAESLWQAAIAQMEAVPPTNPLHAFAQERLTAYRGNLTFAKQQMTGEQESRTRLASARKTAELAESRQNTAQQPQDWQVARATWQVAINTLKQIPRGSTTYGEAQPLLESYQGKLTAVGDRIAQEQQASKAYAQAQKLETQAKALQQKNQWAQATATWRNALSAAKQVPNGTTVSDQAQTLVTTSSDALKQAETVVKIRTDLDRICSATETICSYTITRDMITVRFLPSYERKVRTMGGMSWYARDYNTMAKINTHLASLGSAFQAVATNAGIPVEVYNSDNQAIGGFNPG